MMWRFSFKKQKQKPDVYDTHTQTHTHFFGCITGTSAYSNKVFFASRISGRSININHHFWKNKKSLQHNYHLPGTQTKKIPSFDWHFALVLEGWFASPKNFPDISKFPQVPRSGAWAQTSKASSQSSGIKKWRPDREVPPPKKPGRLKTAKGEREVFFWVEAATISQKYI